MGELVDLWWERFWRRLRADAEALRCPDDARDRVWRRLVDSNPELETATLEVPDDPPRRSWWRRLLARWRS